MRLYNANTSLEVYSICQHCVIWRLSMIMYHLNWKIMKMYDEFSFIKSKINENIILLLFFFFLFIKMEFRQPKMPFKVDYRLYHEAMNSFHIFRNGALCKRYFFHQLYWQRSVSLVLGFLIFFLHQSDVIKDYRVKPIESLRYHH